jgi:hypothetical protein
MPVLDHVLDDVALALEELDLRELLVGLVGQRQVLAQLVDELAVGAVVVLRADVALDQHVDLDGRMDRQREQPLPLVVVETVLPVDAVLTPHLAESLKPNSLPASREILRQFVENLLVEDLSADLEEGD